jgi:hypothetical protein
MIFFTLCSNNYLAQAKILGDSLQKFNPGCRLIIGLTDELNPGIDYSFFKDFTLVPVAEIGIVNFDSLWKKYNIIEFNTCVKASFFKYLFKIYPDEQCFFYFDPDIAVFHSLAILEQELEQSNILITPHIHTPIPLDGKRPTENLFLNFGIYNLGFIGVKRSDVTRNFLDWWEERTLTTGFDKPCHGIFVDQLWINQVPIFYDKVKILGSYGFNVAPWNLHERTIENYNNNSATMNDGSPLYFFHFSTFKFSEPHKISNSPTYNRYSFVSHPSLKPLYDNYCKQLLANRVETLSIIKCAYIEYQQAYRKGEMTIINKFWSFGKNTLREIMPPVIARAIRSIIN